MEFRLTLARIKESLVQRLEKKADGSQAAKDTLTIAWLVAVVESRNKEIERLSDFSADVGRINFLELENFKVRYTGKCVFRVSLIGRGFRLYESSHKDASDTVREAIDKAMKVG